MVLKNLGIILGLFIMLGFYFETPGICKGLPRQVESVNKITLPINLIMADTFALKKGNELILSIIPIESKKILRISFNGNEGTDGTLRIFSVSQKLVKEANFELIKCPYYASLDITEILPGTYQVELTTKKGIHACTLSVK